jgi:hypothetical protein
MIIPATIIDERFCDGGNRLNLIASFAGRLSPTRSCVRCGANE